MNLNEYRNSTQSIGVVFQQIKGIGLRRAQFLLKTHGISFNLPTSQLSDFKFKKLFQIVDQAGLVGETLTYFVDRQLAKHVKLKPFRGYRLIKGLPTRGQRTKSNGRTQKKRPIKDQ